MEARAASLGNMACTLTSTATAHGFYHSLGYRDAGAPVASFGGKPAYPMQRGIGPAPRPPSHPAASPESNFHSG